MKICGLDECGRGALAGPLVACAVIFHEEISLPLKDSKKLSPFQRSKIVSQVQHLPIKFILEIISVEDINKFGIGWANKTIFNRLIQKIDANHYIVDGNLKLEDKTNSSVESVIKADNLYPQVMLASIIAKVHRDDLMSNLHPLFPVYAWNQNKGYGTSPHISSIKRFGISVHHRKDFVTTILNKKTG